MNSEIALRSSGDIIVDRRYTYAHASFEAGDFQAAADLAQQVIEHAPGFAPALALLGRARAALGEPEQAIAALSQALAIEPDDVLGVRIDLAHLGVVSPEAALTASYVKGLFDDYAPKFERHLIKSLRYRGPKLIQEAVRWACAARARPFKFKHVLDLGCGTGLIGQSFEGLYERLVGVDLSPRMLAMARRTHLYHELHDGDLVSFLVGQPNAAADLITAADVFVYMASLDEAFAQAYRCLGRGGLFAFTVQAHFGEGFVLGDDARYAHSERYLRDLAGKIGFTVVSMEQASVRQDRGKDVPGILTVLER